MRIGSFCSGYGGLDLAAEAFFDAETVWWSDIQPLCQQIMGTHWPEATPIGDVTTVNPHDLAEVDVVTAGFPCQPYSQAGNRLGEKDERAIFQYIGDAIGILRPGVIFLENVAAITSLGGLSVVGTLASLGYDTRFGTLRASTIGAPHQRNRWFCVATDTDSISTGRHARTPCGAQTGCRNVTQCSDGFENEIRGRGFWRHYWPAIERWERVLGRPAPEPITDGKLSPLFVEWMMGLDEGHVTHTAASRAKALACLGNGVVPQQAKRALELLT